MLNTKQTIHSVLDKIAKIVDVDQRREALRNALFEDNVLAIIIQRTYHPNYNFNLPPGPLPADVAKKSNHDERGPLYNSIRKWDIFRIPEEVPYNSEMKKHVIEQQFISLYEAVASDDADLLIGIKDKKLPWDTLSAEFVADAIPELFPGSFRPTTEVKVTNIQKATTSEPATLPDQAALLAGIVTADITDILPGSGGSTKEKCAEIIKTNPGLARKDYLQLFMNLGISKSTAGAYYQQLKSKV